MSETDDTDVLLLIPPDFFLVKSSGSEDSLLDSSRTVVHKPPSCTAQVLGKLVNQVHSLESRLDSLELNTTDSISSLGTHPRHKTWDTDSLESRSLDRKCFTFPRRRRRKIANRKSRKRDLSLTSLDSVSTYHKNIPPLKLKPSIEVKPTENQIDDTPSMDGDISSIVSTPSKKNDKLLLHEIDEFLTKVESYESPESKFKSHDTALSPENVIKATGDYISHKLHTKHSADVVKLPSGRTVSSDILDKYIYLVKSNPESALQTERSLPSTSHKNESINDSRVTNLTDTTSKTIPNSKTIQDSRSPSIRKLNFLSENKDVQPTSTPKRLQQPSTSYTDSFRPSSNKIIDRASKVLEQYKSQNYSRNTQPSIIDTSYLPSPKKEEFKLPQMRPFCMDNRDGIKLKEIQNKLIDSLDADLLSLTDLWGDKGDKTERVENVQLEEERLRREHCEAMIQQLQRKILEQQEKLAVAIKVDRAKDAAISKLKDAWIKLTGSLDRAEERHRSALNRMLREVENFKMVADDAQKKTNHFETELYKALDLAHDYQDKCKQLTTEKKHLEEKMETSLMDKDKLIKSKDEEIELLKENYETIMRLNKQSTDCVRNVEDALGKERTEHEVTKSKVNELNRKIQSITEEASLVQQERDLLKEKVNEERARGNILERQMCEKQNQNSELLKKCDTLDTETKSLRKHIELQKNELKLHYQKQLEDAVLNKLQEFQQQLEKAETDIENEAKQKENAIVDTYNRQISRIEEQHKLEINLLEEKQKEEIKLYRLQLAQASEKIGLLESRLESYRLRRGQLASQLHGVMEAQWRQALLILTNCHSNAATANAGSLDATRTDSVSTPLPQDLAPPKIPPLTIPAFADRGLSRAEDLRPSSDKGLNFEGLSDNELQQYVKLLLSKPASLDLGPAPGAERREPPEEPTSDRPDRADRKDKTSKRSLNVSKPPWKA